MKAQNQTLIAPGSNEKDENKEEIDHDLHTLGKIKLKPLLNYLWTDLEKVLVDMPCEFKSDTQKKYRNGFFILTYGAVYIFKNKFLVSPPPAFIIALLDCNTINCDKKSSKITLTFDDFDLEIIINEAAKIIYIMAKIVAECTYGLGQHLILPRFQIKGKSNEIFEKDKLKKRKSLKLNYKRRSNSLNNSPSSKKQNDDDDDSINDSPLSQKISKNENNSTTSENSSNSHSNKKQDDDNDNSVNDSHSNKKQNDDVDISSVKNSPSNKKQSDNDDGSISNSSSNKKQSDNDDGSVNNSPSDRKKNKRKNKNSPNDRSSIHKKSKDESNSENENLSTTETRNNEQNEENHPTSIANISYSQSDSCFFYYGSDKMYSAFERIHLSSIATTRPKHALVNRCLFLAHFYNIFGRRLGDGCKYMEEYDKDPGKTLVIGHNFIPGKFSLSYGHAIGWETNLTKVIFYHFKPMFFGQLLESLLINSITISQVCFVDYKFSDKKLSELEHSFNKNLRKRIKKQNKKSEKEIYNEEEDNDDDDDEKQTDPKEYFDHFVYKNKNDGSSTKYPIYIPDFSFNKVTSTNVNSFWFHECDYPVISTFFKKLKDYACPISELEISSCELTSTQLAKIFKNMTNLECFNELKTLALLKNTIKMFPINDYSQFINSMCNLEVIEISDSDLDGSILFSTLCKLHSPVKSVKLSNLKFNELNNMSSLTIPPTLIHADFSQSSFSPKSFKDILLLFTNKKTKKVMPNCNKITVELANSELSVMLCMANIKMNQEGYEVFNTLDFPTLSDNICEFDWSQNKLPSNCVNSFFKFLETQKKMRILMLNNIILDKQKYFFKRLLKYVMHQKLPGLDMRAKLYRKYGIPFYESLKEATFLRKLGVVIRNGSDEAMNKFTELIKVLPMLTECKADGFLPNTKESLINMWKSIINHPTICATDLPRVDSVYLENRRKIKIDDEEFIQMLKDVEAAGKAPSNMQQRTDFTLAQIRARNENIENIDQDKSDFFIASCSTPWIDSTPHSRLEDLQNSHNFEEHYAMTPLIDNTIYSTSPFEVTTENGDESLLLNIYNTKNENETYDMQCIPDDIQNSGIAPTKMPDYNNPDENNQNNNEINKTNEVDDAEEDEFDDQSIDDIDESESDCENED